jgi:hypothetical protein
MTVRLKLLFRWLDQSGGEVKETETEVKLSAVLVSVKIRAKSVTRAPVVR